MPMFVNRVGTVLSLTQLEQDSVEFEAKSKLLTPDAKVVDVHGSYLPVYNYAKATVIQSKRIRSFGDLLSIPDVESFVSPELASDSSASDDDVLLDGPSSPTSVARSSPLDHVLTSEWDKRSDQGLFRYDVKACESKLLPGKWGFVSQCNEGRGSKKRATEYRIDQVVQKFDKSKFNFTKALQKEVLFAFDMGNKADVNAQDQFELKAMQASPNLVFINVSPIEYGHVLLVPRVLDFLPQIATPETVLACVSLVKASGNPYFRAGFNSLGAYGTINHLHFQAYYLHAPFPIERAVNVPIEDGVGKKRRRTNVLISQLADYPVKSLVFELGDSLEELATLVGESCMRLAAANIPHNLIVADEGARIFLIPQCFAEKQATGEISEEILETQVNPAAFEIAGHLPLKRREDYDNIDEEFAIKLLSTASLSEERFNKVIEMVLENN